MRFCNVHNAPSKAVKDDDNHFPVPDTKRILERRRRKHTLCTDCTPGDNVPHIVLPRSKCVGGLFTIPRIGSSLSLEYYCWPYHRRDINVNTLPEDISSRPFILERTNR